MGRATRWLKSLFGIKKEKDQGERSNSGDRKNNNAIASTGLCHNPATIPPNITPAEVSWLRSFYDDSENEQSKHAIAVAAATAAAADAAVAAAQAAVAVVRLTSQGRGTMFGGVHERWAAVKIQAAFRGYLSRKALRALKGLVKLQALVRGYLVRKQTTATLHSMQALVRAQASVLARKTRRFVNNDDGFHAQFRARKSIERFDDTRSEHTASIHSRRLSASFEAHISATDGSPKIVEVDTGRPKSRSKRGNTWASDSREDPYAQAQTLSSPLPCRTPARLPMPDSSEWALTGDQCRFSTPQSTPRFANSSGSNPPVTPARSLASGDSFFRRYANFPNYMSSTQSFKNKLRSQSAPKQRPELGPKKRLSLNEIMESRSSVSGVKMGKSCSRVQEVIDFKNAVMSKFVREPSRDYYMDHGGEMVRD